MQFVLCLWLLGAFLVLWFFFLPTACARKEKISPHNVQSMFCGFSLFMSTCGSLCPHMHLICLCDSRLSVPCTFDMSVWFQAVRTTYIWYVCVISGCPYHIHLTCLCDSRLSVPCTSDLSVWFQAVRITCIWLVCVIPGCPYLVNVVVTSFITGLVFFIILLYIRRYLLRMLLAYRGWMCKCW